MFPFKPFRRLFDDSQRCDESCVPLCKSAEESMLLLVCFVSLLVNVCLARSLQPQRAQTKPQNDFNTLCRLTIEF